MGFFRDLKFGLMDRVSSCASDKEVSVDRQVRADLIVETTTLGFIEARLTAWLEGMRALRDERLEESPATFGFRR